LPDADTAYKASTLSTPNPNCTPRSLSLWCMRVHMELNPKINMLLVSNYLPTKSYWGTICNIDTEQILKIGELYQLLV
jgi:hypothetical protein